MQIQQCTNIHTNLGTLTQHHAQIMARIHSNGGAGKWPAPTLILEGRSCKPVPWDRIAHTRNRWIRARTWGFNRIVVQNLGHPLNALSQSNSKFEHVKFANGPYSTWIDAPLAANYILRCALQLWPAHQSYPKSAFALPLKLYKGVHCFDPKIFTKTRVLWNWHKKRQ